ncbi:hypothetical protein CPB83DRAFT_742670, partial [Crepidotus variabilis]
VDDLCLLWDKGLFLSKTSTYPNGRPVRAAMVPLICDLPAARRAVGLGSHSSTHFCSECDLTLQDINDLDSTTWTPRNYNAHILHATNWRDAPTEDVQDQTFKASGIKWSELLRLPYWDPTRFVVMDSMHGFYLRMFMRHVRDVWGMQVNLEDGDGLPHGDLENLSEDSIAEIQRVLRYEPVAKLRKLKKGELQYLCRHAGLHYGGQKSWMAKLLAQHQRHTPLTKVKAGDLAQLDTLYHTKSKAGLSRTKKALLVALCAIRFAGASRNHHEFNQMNRKSLVEIIHEQRLAEGLVDEDGDLLVTQEKGSTTVLGAHVLSEIRSDMNKIEAPSWWPPSPKHPGEIKWGKFKAEEWRSFCLVNLPITLTRLWGILPKESRQYQMLENYMLLVNAIKIATSRSISHEMISSYEQYMLRYLQGFLRLYPHKNLTPYQHLSLHFGDHLRRFGPTHSWRCYAFERMNGLVQGLPSNSRFGK